MKKTLLLTLLVLALSLVLVACGGGGDDTASDAGNGVGNVKTGEKLYKQTTIGSANAPGCSTCHSLDPDTVIVGPSHDGIATKAKSAVAGLTAEEYLRKSIVDPDGDITEDYTPGVMYQSFATELTETEVNDLVAFMLTLE